MGERDRNRYAMSNEEDVCKTYLHVMYRSYANIYTSPFVWVELHAERALMLKIRNYNTKTTTSLALDCLGCVHTLILVCDMPPWSYLFMFIYTYKHACVRSGRRCQLICGAGGKKEWATKITRQTSNFVKQGCSLFIFALFLSCCFLQFFFHRSQSDSMLTAACMSAVNAHITAR